MSVKKIMVSMLCAAVIFTLSGCDFFDYRSAADMMENGQWAEAREVLVSLEDYKDSAELIKECDYNIALDNMDSGKYDDALELFNSLGDYKDSAEMVSKCTYLKAKALSDEGKYDEAIELFESLGDYEDSAELITECTYLKAGALYSEGKYDDALSLYITLGDYKDAYYRKVICSLLTAPNSFIDSVVEEMKSIYIAEDIPYSLEEEIRPYECDERSFLVTGDDSSESTYVIFTHRNPNGSSTARGQINGFTVLGDADSIDMIEVVYPEFASSAGILLGILDGTRDSENNAMMIDAEVQKLVTNGPTEGNTAKYEFEHEGYSCSLATLVLDDFCRFVFSASIPELME